MNPAPVSNNTLSPNSDKNEISGDPKTLTPGPWTSPTDWVMDNLMDRSMDHLDRPPLRTPPNNSVEKTIYKII